MSVLIWEFLEIDRNDPDDWYRHERLAQYITMSPTGDDDEAREERIQAWRDRRPTPRWPGDSRDWEHRHQEPAELTALGRKLLGVDFWN